MSGFYLSQTNAPITSQMWLIYAVGAMTIVYAAFLRPMMQRRKDPLAKQPGRLGSLARQRDVEKQMESLLVELSAMARQITAQLDTRAAKLELLLKEADQKIAALQAPRSPPEPHTPGAVGRDMPPRTEDARHAGVYELADSGLSPVQIAQRLARPSGEVELILALRPRKL